MGLATFQGCLMKIRYVGHKAEKPDNVAGSGIVWHGHGDVQEVPAGFAAKLLKHVDVWDAAGPAEPVQIGLADAFQSDAQPPKLANISEPNPEDHDDDQVAVAPGAMPPAPGTQTVPQQATRRGRPPKAKE